MSLQEFIEDQGIPVEITADTTSGSNHITKFGRGIGGQELFLKYADNEVDAQSVKRGYNACSILGDTLDVDVSIPEPRIYCDQGDEVLVGYKRVNSICPSEQHWQREGFCNAVIDSAARLLNELHMNTQLYGKLMQSEHCSKYVDRVEDARRELQAFSNEQLDPYRKQSHGALDRLHDEQQDRPIRFSHQDFTTVNYAFSEGGLHAVFDWENCGFFDPMRDIAVFESAVIDEFIEHVHPDTVDEFRDRFREKLWIDCDVNRIALYKYVNLVIVLGYILDGECTDMWLEVGTVKEAIAQKERQLSELEPIIR